MTSPEFIIDTDDKTVFRLSGRLVTDALHIVEKPLAQVSVTAPRATVDLSNLEALDTAGASMIATMQRRLEAEGVLLDLQGVSPDNLRLIETVKAAAFVEDTEEIPKHGVLDWVAGIGSRVVEGLKSAGSLMSFLGLVITRLGRTILRPSSLRATALVAQMQQTGFNAVPIIGLMGFLIGIVLAYQGSAQLRQFGAEVFVVDLIAVSVLRELGILLTAIIVAGRSGSAFAAAIGSMKVNEEIDAMRTIGLDPIDVLVLPRLIALTLMLPILGLVANVTALFGGALMSWLELGVSPGMFVTRFLDNTDVWHLAVGMMKAPVFAVIIAIVACWQGLQVGGSAESVGQKTTASVVQAIFLVIIMDAVFSIFFSELGL